MIVEFSALIDTSASTQSVHKHSPVKNESIHENKPTAPIINLTQPYSEVDFTQNVVIDIAQDDTTREGGVEIIHSFITPK